MTTHLSWALSHRNNVRGPVDSPRKKSALVVDEINAFVRVMTYNTRSGGAACAPSYCSPPPGRHCTTGPCPNPPCGDKGTRQVNIRRKTRGNTSITEQLNHAQRTLQETRHPQSAPPSRFLGTRHIYPPTSSTREIQAMDKRRQSPARRHTLAHVEEAVLSAHTVEDHV